MPNLEELLNIIELNCKNQFGYHVFWFEAKAAYTALGNNKLSLAKQMNDRLYKRVFIDKSIVDATLTFNKFCHTVNDRINAQKSLVS